nr:hypothetical protein [Tanacetum cinerariifolium]
MTEEIDKDENVNLVKSSEQREAHEKAESASKDKGKAIMQESESPKKIKKKEMTQISLDKEIAQRFYEEEQAQILRDKEYAQQIQADKDLAQRMLEKERESLSIEERSRLLAEFIDKRKNKLAAKGAEEKRNKPPKIKMLFNNTIESIRRFVPMESKGQAADSKVGEGSSKEGERLKRSAEEELGQEQKVKEEIAQQEDVVAKKTEKESWRKIEKKDFKSKRRQGQKIKEAG